MGLITNSMSIQPNFNLSSQVANINPNVINNEFGLNNSKDEIQDDDETKRNLNKKK